MQKGLYLQNEIWNKKAACHFRWEQCTLGNSKISPICTCLLRTAKELQLFTFGLQFSSVQSLSPVRLFATPWIAAHQASLSITNSRSLPTHIHRVGDAIQPSHPLSSPSPPAPNPSQHQGLFQWVNSSHEVAKILEFQLQYQFFQWIPRTDLL